MQRATTEVVFLLVVLFLFTGAFSGDVIVYLALFVVMVLLIAVEILLVLVQPCYQHGEGEAMAQLDEKLGNWTQSK